MPVKPFSEYDISKTNEASDAKMAGIEAWVQLYRYLRPTYFELVGPINP
jgi:hypothetical protein